MYGIQKLFYFSAGLSGIYRGDSLHLLFSLFLPFLVLKAAQADCARRRPGGIPSYRFEFIENRLRLLRRDCSRFMFSHDGVVKFHANILL